MDRAGKSDVENIFDNRAIGLHILDNEGRIVRVNRAELELLGYEEAEYVGQHFADFHADKTTSDEIQECLSSGEPLERYPARLIAKDGSIRHVLITTNANGESTQTRCFTLDITGAIQAEERAQEGEQRFQDVLEGMPVAVYTLDAEGRVTFYNHAAAELAGRVPRIGIDKWCIFERVYTTDGALLPENEYPIVNAVRQAQQIESAEYIGERPDGTRLRVAAQPTVLFDRDGRLAGAVNVVLDMTERHLAEVESAHMAAIVSSSSDAIVSKSLDGIIRSWNDGAMRIFGYKPEEIIGRPITTIIPPELHDEEKDILARLRNGERIEHFETVRIAKDGRRLDISLTVSSVRDKSGRIIGASKVARDITDRKRAERLQRLLISELNHRVKNTLATVQSIANQTVRLARTPAEAAASFTGRIQSLAHAHDLLTRNSWQGADILSLVRDQVLLNSSEDPRISLSGPSLTLEPQPAVHLALILHELGTNARKYGSLSMPEGRLDINWTVHSGKNSHLLLEWRESCGPAVQVPVTRGFGTILIEKSLAAHGGEVSVDYNANGVICSIMLPVPERPRLRSAMTGAIKTTTSRPGSERAEIPSAIQGKHVLVIEDEALIAMDIAETLAESGCIVGGPAVTLEQARRLVAEGNYDAVLLDANLDGNPVDEIAAALTRKNVPFAFLTGYEREALPEAFREAPLINKPFTRQDAIDIIARLTARDEAVIPMVRAKR